MAELYLLTPPRIDDAFAATLARTLDAGPAAALQIRLKDHDEADIRTLAPGLIEAAHARGVTVILNDDPQLASALGCDGVHVGQTDAGVRQARADLGPKAVIGATCHDSRHLAMLAGEQGADYVAFGSVFETATKTPKSRAPLELFSWWRELFELPSVAIGGITPDNARPVVEAGADYLAVSGGIWNWPDGPERACEAFSHLLD